MTRPPAIATGCRPTDVDSPNEERPPRRNPGGQRNRNVWPLAFDRVPTLCALCFRRVDLQTHFLAQCSGEEPADGMTLPARGGRELFQRGSARPLQHAENLGSHAILLGAGRLLRGRLARLRAFSGLGRRLGLLGRLRLGRGHVRPVWRDTRLFGYLWCLDRGIWLGSVGFYSDFVHITFSFGGDCRDHMNQSGWPELQANSDRIRHGRRIHDPRGRDREMAPNGAK